MLGLHDCKIYPILNPSFVPKNVGAALKAIAQRTRDASKLVVFSRIEINLMDRGRIEMVSFRKIAQKIEHRRIKAAD